MVELGSPTLRVKKTTQRARKHPPWVRGEDMDAQRHKWEKISVSLRDMDVFPRESPAEVGKALNKRLRSKSLRLGSPVYKGEDLEFNISPADVSAEPTSPTSGQSAVPSPPEETHAAVIKHTRVDGHVSTPERRSRGQKTLRDGNPHAGGGAAECDDPRSGSSRELFPSERDLSPLQRPTASELAMTNLPIQSLSPSNRRSVSPFEGDAEHPLSNGARDSVGSYFDENADLPPSFCVTSEILEANSLPSFEPNSGAPSPHPSGAEDFLLRGGQQHQVVGPPQHHKRIVKAVKESPLKVFEYENIFWFFFILTQAITCGDRFLVNLWPLGVDNPGPLHPEWSTSAFEILAWLTGRLLIVSTNALMVTQMRVLGNWMTEVAPRWIKMGDIHEVHNRIHRKIGIWWLGVPIVLHVWSILLPWMAGVEMQVYSTWSRPNHPVTKKRMPFYADGVVSLSMNDVYRLILMSLLFFIIIPYSMSTRGKRWSWSFAMYAHIFGTFMFIIDMLRMKSHPHSHIFNTPVVFAYMADRLYSVWYYRRNAATVVSKVRLDADYLLVLLRLPGGFNYSKREVGDVYWINSLETSMEMAHPFTTFTNYTNELQDLDEESMANASLSHKFGLRHEEVAIKSMCEDVTSPMDQALPAILVMERRDSADFQKSGPLSFADKVKGRESVTNLYKRTSEAWDLGIIVQVHKKNELRRHPWTERFAKSLDLTLRTWGPYRSEYGTLTKLARRQKKALTQSREVNTNLARALPHTHVMPPLLLIASGAGGSYIIDYVLYLTSLGPVFDLVNPVKIVYTTRSLSLFQFFTDMTCKRRIDNLTVLAHLTYKGESIVYHNSHQTLEFDGPLDVSDSEDDKDSESKDAGLTRGLASAVHVGGKLGGDRAFAPDTPGAQRGTGARDAVLGRPTFTTVLDETPRGAHVYFCGAPKLQKKVAKQARARCLTVRLGHSFQG